MRRRILWGRVIGLIVVIGIVGTLAFASRILNRFRDKNTSLGDVITGIRDPRKLFPGQDRLTILLIGQDYNHDNRGYTSSKNTRADTIMMLSVDLEKKQLRACSVPRDTYVTAPDGKTGKINATYTRGGPKLLKETLQNLLGVAIDYYLVIKPDAVREIVDSVGGVEVEALDAMNYDDNWGGLHVHLAAGRQRVDGKQAEGFVRFREVNRFRMDADGHMIPLQDVKHSKEEGDIRRMARQQQLIQALTHAASSPGNIMKADSIIETGFNQVETDLSRVKCLALANTFKGSSKAAMVTGTLPGVDTKKGKVYFFELDQIRARQMVDWIIRGDETAAKKLIRVGVKNGTQVKGVAKAVAENLSHEGYTAASLGNAPPAPMTLITFQKAAHEDLARQIQKSIGATAIHKAAAISNKSPDIEIVIGEDIAKQIAPMQNPKPTRQPR